MLDSLLVGLSLTLGQFNPQNGPGTVKGAPGSAPAPVPAMVQAQAVITADPKLPAPADKDPAPPVKVAPGDVPPPPPPPPDDKKEEKKNGNGDECKEKEKEEKPHVKKTGCLPARVWKYYCECFGVKHEDKDKCNGEEKKEDDKAKCNGNGDEKKEDDDPGKRPWLQHIDAVTNEKRWDAYPEPWSSPPFPMSEYQGYPLPGVGPVDERWPLMEALYDGPMGDWLKESRIKFYGWVTGSGNWSTANHVNPAAAGDKQVNLNLPDSYWLVGNHYELDQAVFRLEREPNLADPDHMDIGFRTTAFYGMDYRFTYSEGWGSDQYQKHNLLYGWDPLENYIDWWIPWIGKGLDIRVGRWVACPDIETQLAPDNYLASHSILFTYDTYTQTGVMLTQRINKNLIVQGGINCGDDQAFWGKNVEPSGYFGVRYVFGNNRDAVYSVLNQINDARYRRYFTNTPNGDVETGHDNYNYEVTTWEHVFSKNIHTKTEAYYMWENDAVLGGTPSAGPIGYGTGGGLSPINSYSPNVFHFPFTTQAYGCLNYTMFAIPTIAKDDFITVRNEFYRDASGFRTGFPGMYTSHTIGITHNFNKCLQLRPEIGYYRNWTGDAFDSGFARGIWIYGADMTIRW